MKDYVKGINSCILVVGCNAVLTAWVMALCNYQGHDAGKFEFAYSVWK